jgi:hypothetical protein
MLGKRRAAWVSRLVVVDVLALLVSFLVAYWLRVLLNEPIGRAAGPLGYYVWLLVLILPAWLGWLARTGSGGRSGPGLGCSSASPRSGSSC